MGLLAFQGTIISWLDSFHLSFCFRVLSNQNSKSCNLPVFFLELTPEGAFIVVSINTFLVFLEFCGALLFCIVIIMWAVLVYQQLLVHKEIRTEIKRSHLKACRAL